MSPRGSKGGLQIYVVDELTSVVQVIDNGGGWVRSVGTKGTGKGQLASPHGMTVDEDGNVWVADSGFGTERISKFGPSGGLKYSFATAGTERLVSPKGVGLDQQGKIYIATLVESGGGGAFRYREEAPTLFAGLYGGDPFWVNTKGVWLWLRYNGIEQTCRAGGSATCESPRRIGAGIRDRWRTDYHRQRGLRQPPEDGHDHSADDEGQHRLERRQEDRCLCQVPGALPGRDFAAEDAHVPEIAPTRSRVSARGATNDGQLVGRQTRRARRRGICVTVRG